MMMPTMNAIIVTPICPHSLSVRPIVLSDQSTLDISIQPEQDPANVSIDGQSRKYLQENEHIYIKKADFTVKWVSIGKRDFFEILRTKLNWGEKSQLQNKKK
jgi:NAD+ kinase